MSTTDNTACGCGSKEKVTLFFSCSGASNVGQLTHELALRVTREGLGTMSCIAGVGAHNEGFIESARNCDRLVVLDGCPKNCAGKLFEHVGIKPDIYLTLTDHGFEKRPGASPLPEELERGRNLLLKQLVQSSC